MHSCKSALWLMLKTRRIILTQRFEFLKNKQAKVSSIPAPKKVAWFDSAKPTSNTKYWDGSGPDDINTATFDKLTKSHTLKQKLQTR